MKLTEEQHKEVVEIDRIIEKHALRLRYIIQQHNEDMDSSGPLPDAVSLLHAGHTAVKNYLDPQHSAQLDWQRKRHIG